MMLLRLISGLPSTCFVSSTTFHSYNPLQLVLQLAPLYRSKQKLKEAKKIFPKAYL